MLRDPALRRLARGATAVLVATITACADDPAGPVDPAPATYDLVFEARVRGFTELVTLPLAGGTPAPLFAGEVNGRHAAPSPDGRRVAYWDMADDEIWVVDRVTGARTNISRCDDDIDIAPTWSPDGALLAYTTFCSEASDIVRVRADGTGRVVLTPDDYNYATFDQDAAWSPDGTRIAFSSDREGGRSLYTVRADGTGLTRITTDPTARDREPSWSPDGTRIVFRRTFAVANVLDADLAIVDADGGNLRVLAAPGREEHPSWSPDGALIAFDSDRTNAEYRIFTVRPDGSDVVERAGGAAYGRHATRPRWIRRIE